MKDDIYIRFLQQYYDEHKTINDIPVDKDGIVIFEGKKLSLKNFFSTMRKFHRDYEESFGKISATSLQLTRHNKLNKMHFSWETTSLKKGATVLKEPAIRYLEEHLRKNGTINDISSSTVVEFEGAPLKIGEYLKNISVAYNEYHTGVKTQTNSNPISMVRYKVLTDMGLEWSIIKRNAEIEVNNDPNTRYLKEYYAQHGTINDIPRSKKVLFEGEVLHIGTFIRKTRASYIAYMQNPEAQEQASERLLARFRMFSSLNFAWEMPQPIEKPVIIETVDPYLEYIKYHYEKYGTINDIFSTQKVEFNGQVLLIGKFLYRMRQDYKADIQNGFANISGQRKRRYETLCSLDFMWEKPKITTFAEIARENKVESRALIKLAKKVDNSADKALKIYNSLLMLEQEREKQSFKDASLRDILELLGIDTKTFIAAISSLKAKSEKESAAYSEEMTLGELCAVNNYDFGLLSRAISLKVNNLSTESFANTLITHKMEENSCRRYIASWVYRKYQPFEEYRQIIESHGLNSVETFRYISRKAIPLDEGLEYKTFKANSSTENSYLEGVYHELIDYVRTLPQQDVSTQSADELVAEELIRLTNDYDLTENELSILTKSYTQYKAITERIKTIEDYSHKSQTNIANNQPPSNTKERSVHNWGMMSSQERLETLSALGISSENDKALQKILTKMDHMQTATNSNKQ